jgi:hypothetical protein
VDGGGFPGAARKRAARSTCRWKALRVVEAGSFDEGLAEAILAVR